MSVIFAVLLSGHFLILSMRLKGIRVFFLLLGYTLSATNGRKKIYILLNLIARFVCKRMPFQKGKRTITIPDLDVISRSPKEVLYSTKIEYFINQNSRYCFLVSDVFFLQII